MWILFGIVTLLFLSSAFFTQVAPQSTEQLLVTYVLTQFSFISTYFIVFIIGVLIVVSVFFRSNFDKRQSSLKIFMLAVIQTVFVFAGALLSSFVVLWVIAFLHLTTFSVLFSTNPRSLGIVSDTKTIMQRLGRNYQNVRIVIADSNLQTPLIALAKATSGTDNFYGKYLLSAMPQAVILPIKSDIPAMMLLDGTLIVTKADKAQLEELSPVLGYLLVKQIFPLRAIKSYPNISFMSKDMYSDYRREDANKQLAALDTEIEKIQGIVSSLSASLKTDTKQQYNTKKLLSEYDAYETYFKSQKQRMQSATTHIPNELGVFREQNTIQIIFAPTINGGQGTVSLIDYFEILVHEYLHYASFVSANQRITNPFFEEALTEYFARSAIQQAFSTNTNLGYPLQAKVMREMTNMYTDSELAELYFTKDEAALANAIDRVYGDNFYEDNYVMFETMQYTSSPAQALEIANSIMKKIGGKQLTKKDLMSNYTN